MKTDMSSLVEAIEIARTDEDKSVKENQAAAATEAVLRAVISAELDCKVFTLVLYVFVFGTMCIFGLVGNVLSFVVMQVSVEYELTWNDLLLYL